MVKYGKNCKYDDDCKSEICEMTYSNSGRPIGRKCVIQKPRYGKSCNYNRDCISNRCVMVFDDDGNPIGKKCKVIKGQTVPKRGWPYDDDGMPDEFKASKKQRAVRNETVILSKYEKARVFQGRGPVAEFIVLVMEIIIMIVAKIVDVLWIIWKTIFTMIYDLIFGAFRLEDALGSISRSVKKNGVCIQTYWLKQLVTILFPPFGVFLAVGVTGFGHILLCSILTLFFYFPGLIYAYFVIKAYAPK